MTDFAPRLVTPPAASPLPVTLAEVKAHLRIDDAEQDAVLTALLGAVIAHLDGWSGVLGRCIMAQTWEQAYPAFERVLRLPLGPASAVVSITYADAAGADQTVAAPGFVLLRDHLSDYVMAAPGAAWPAIGTRYDAVRVRWTAGVATAAEVPQPIRSAMLLLVGHLYRDREGALSIEGWPPAVRLLLNPYRPVGT
jgi:uncharacterized phiE125 gp8 family phage protein